MATIRPQFYGELSRRVDEVLHYLWDPIGISDEPNARNEYASYLPSVLTLLLANTEATKIALHLHNLATQNLGLSPNLDHSTEVAQILIEWKNTLNERYA